MIDRRDEIADEFMKHFHHFGFKKTSVDEVAGQLHISKKTIYEYFESKEDMFKFVITRESKKIGSQMEVRLKTAHSGDEKIRTLIHMIFENAVNYILASKNLDFKTQDEIATRAFQFAYEDILRRVVDEGKQSRKFSQSIGELELSYIFAVILQGLNSLRKNPDNNPEKSVCSMVLKMLS
jgi:TetR/AcrR family transcriptional repressor of mexJK operon